MGNRHEHIYSKELLAAQNRNPSEVRDALRKGRWVDMNAFLAYHEPAVPTPPQPPEKIPEYFPRPSPISLSLTEPPAIEFKHIEVTGIALDIAISEAAGKNGKDIKLERPREDRQVINEGYKTLEALGKKAYPESVAPFYSAILSLAHMGKLSTEIPKKELTPQEHTLLKKLSAGEGIHQPTEGFNLKNTHIKRAIDRLRTKLGAETKSQLLVIAVTLYPATTPQS